MLKRIISAILASAMLISGTALAVSDDEYLYDVTDKAMLDKIDVLSKFGLIKVYMDGSFRGFEKVTRSEFARLMCDYLGLEVNENAPKTGLKFTDVKSDHDDYGYIKRATEYGLMNGVSDTEFNPDGSITNVQAVKVLLHAMDFGSIAQNMGGYPEGYVKLGISLGMMKDSAEVSITKEGIVDILYNSYDIRIPKINYDGGKITYTDDEDGETILSRYHNIYKFKGIVEGNEYTSLAGDKYYQNNQLYANGTVFDTDFEDAYKYLGYDVEYYAQVDDSKGLYKIISVTKRSKNKVLEIDGDDVISAPSKTSLTYDNNGKNKTIKISPVCDMIYNRVSNPYFTEKDYFLNSGTLTFIDNNGDSEYDICVVEDNKTVVVESVSTVNNSLKNVYTAGNDTIKEFRFEDMDEDYTEVYKNGVRILPEDIKKGDILTVLSSKDGRVNIITVGGETVSGKIESINKTENTITVDGKELELGYAYLNAVKNNDAQAPILALGQEATFYTDLKGEIVFAEIGAVYNYGYVRKIGLNEDTEGNKWVKIFNEKEDNVIYNFADKVKIDGTTVNGSNVNISVNQLVRYKLNANGEVNNIQQAQIIPDSEVDSAIINDVFRVKEFNSITYRSQNNSLDSKYYLDNSTKIYIVPEDTDEKIDDDDYYYLTNASDLKADGYYKTYVYDFDEDNYVKRIVVKRINNSDNMNIRDNALFIVQRVSEAMGAEKEPLQQIEGFYNGINMTLRGIDNVIFNDVQQGDILQVVLNNDGRVYFVEKFFDFSEGFKTTSVFVESFHSWPNLGTLYANITKSNDRILRLTTTGGDYALRPQGSVTIYDARENKAYAASYSDLMPGDFVIVRYRESFVSNIIAIRK